MLCGTWNILCFKEHGIFPVSWNMEYFMFHVTWNILYFMGHEIFSISWNMENFMFHRTWNIPWFMGHGIFYVSPLPRSSHFLWIHPKGADSATLIASLDTLKKSPKNKQINKKSPQNVQQNPSKFCTLKVELCLCVCVNLNLNQSLNFQSSEGEMNR